MGRVDVKTWWDNRDKLNDKMLRSLLEELETMRTSARISLTLEDPPLGLDPGDHEQRTQELIGLLSQKIQELDEMIYQRAN